MKISYIQKRPCTAEKVGWNLLPPLSSILSNSVHEYVFLYFMNMYFCSLILYFMIIITIVITFSISNLSFQFWIKTGQIQFASAKVSKLIQNNRTTNKVCSLRIKKHINLSCVKLLRLGTSEFHQNSSLDLYSIKAITIYHIIDIVYIFLRICRNK